MITIQITCAYFCIAFGVACFVAGLYFGDDESIWFNFVARPIALGLLWPVVVVGALIAFIMDILSIRAMCLLGMLLCGSVDGQIQIMTSARERIFRAYIPKLSGPSPINEKLAQAILFTDEEIPRAYQVRANGSTVFFATGSQLQGESGQSVGLRWIYPSGTLVFDFLLKSFSDQTWACYTVRVREREIDDWDADSYVPFPRAGCLEGLTSGKGAVTSRESEELKKTFWVLELPPIAGSRDLLRSKIFEPQSGEPFLTDDGHDIFAPTASDHDNIVPANYLGSAIGADRESCLSCHRDTLSPVRPSSDSRVSGGMEGDSVARISKVKALWLPPNPNGGVWPIIVWWGWLKPGYAYEEGSDGIKTIHPIDPSAIGPPVKEPQLRQSFVNAGVVAWYVPEKHPASVYQQIKVYSNY